MKTRWFVIGILALMIGIISCSKDENSPFSKVTVVVKSSTTNVLKSASLVTTLELTDVIVNIKEIEFEFDDDHDGEGNQEDSTITDIELDGPFVLNLLSDGLLLNEVLGKVEFPNAGYDELEFELSPATHVGMEDPIYGRSVYLSGTIDAVPFEMWSYTDDEVEIEFPDSSSFLLDGASFFLYIDFHIDQILTGLQTLDLGQAVDGNQNGVIEIGPDDEDGNHTIAEQIIHYLKESFDLDDDDDNENDDD